MPIECAYGSSNGLSYADDFVATFEQEHDARRFFAALPGRLGKFGLEVAPEKTRVLRFGRFSRRVSASVWHEPEGQIQGQMVDGAGEVPREGVGHEGLDSAQPNSVARRHLENSECQIGGSLRLLFGQRQFVGGEPGA